MEEPIQVRAFPIDVDVRRVDLKAEEIDRSVTHNLVGEGDIATPREVRFQGTVELFVLSPDPAHKPHPLLRNLCWPPTIQPLCGAGRSVRRRSSEVGRSQRFGPLFDTEQKAAGHDEPGRLHDAHPQPPSD
jgi:hypothetical protein